MIILVPMKPKIVIIGGGAAGICLASQINTKSYHVVIFEKSGQLGRKLLVAGKGGFNLSHGEPIAQLVKRYTPVNFLSKSLKQFDNNYLRSWFNAQNIPTYIGSSHRIFPEKGQKPIQVLNAMVNTLKKNEVQICSNHKWDGFQDGKLKFIINNEFVLISFDYVVFALGGSSWHVTGSDGKWTDYFNDIKLLPFKPSNCSYQVNWSTEFIKTSEGQPIKNISVTHGGQTVLGELMITKFGLEGSSIYALSPSIRDDFSSLGKVKVFIDLKPSLTIEVIKNKLNSTKKKSWTNHVQKSLNLSKEKLRILKAHTSESTFKSIEKLPEFIKCLPIELIGVAELDEAISTVGGIDLSEVDANFELKKRPNQFAIGEMLNWDAPTGGYLIQGCFSMANYLANHLNKLS